MGNSVEDLLGEILAIGQSIDSKLDSIEGAAQKEAERSIQESATSSESMGAGTRGGGSSSGFGSFGQQARNLMVNAGDNQAPNFAGGRDLAKNFFKGAAEKYGGKGAGDLVEFGANASGYNADTRVERNAWQSTRDHARRYAAAGGEVTLEMANSMKAGDLETQNRLKQSDDVVAKAYGFEERGKDKLGMNNKASDKSLNNIEKNTRELVNLMRGGG